MDITEIRRITELLKKANCSTHALISETARELGVRKTALMQYIEDNPKLFSLGEARSRTAKGTVRSHGLAIIKVYPTPEENPDTEEWLEARKKEWEKKIHVGEQTYYGQHEYWLIPEDDPKQALDVNRKLGLYRNTPEKIRFLEDKRIIRKVSGGYGGFGDYHETEYYPYGEDVQKALEEIGWTTDFKETT